MASWLTDGSSVFRTNWNLIVSQVDYNWNGGKYNCIWQEGDGVSMGKHYWKIHFRTLERSGSASVGLTSKNRLKPQFGSNALEYNGHLCDGFCLRVWDFGPRLTEGDVVGVLAVFEDDRLKMYIDLNGRSLGLAFDVPASIFTSVCPYISFTRSGSAKCTKKTEIPIVSDRVPESFTGIEGDWKLKQFQVFGIDADPVSERRSKIRYQTKNRNFLWSVWVCNEIDCILTTYGKGYCKTSDVSQTLKGSLNPNVRKFEQLMFCLIKEVKFIEIGPEGDISFKSDTMSSEWTRYEVTGPGPFVGDPFTKYKRGSDVQNVVEAAT